MTRIAVTGLEYEKARSVFMAAKADGFECLPAPKEEAELAAFLKRHGIAHVIIGVDRYEDALYEAIPEGGAIARFGVGHDGVDKVKAKARGIYCFNTPGALDNSVAEMAICLMLAAARRVPGAAAGTSAGKWNPRVGMELSGRRLAVIGCGAIGRRTGRIAALGLGMKVVGFDPSVKDPEILKRDFGFSELRSHFEEAVCDADFVTLHIPGIPATKDFINAKTLAMMPKHATLVNTARGIIIDEDALYESLKSGSIAGAALDVFKKEPYEPSSPGRDLRSLPNVVMTPHMGSATAEACERMAKAALENIRRSLNPETLKGLPSLL